MRSNRHWILILIILFFINNAFAASPPSDSAAPILKKVMPAVVNIRAQYSPMAFVPQPNRGRKKPPANNDNEGNQSIIPTSVASGVIVDAKNGYILTNNHAVEDAQT